MKQAKPALRYAKAILELAKDKNVETEVNDDMKLVFSTITESDDLKNTLKSPVVKDDDKKKVLNVLFGDKVNNITKGLFSILEENKRLEMLGAVAEKYSVVYKEDKGIKEAVVTTAVPLTKEIEQKVQDKIVSLTGGNATIKNIVDSSILGGFVLRIGDVEYDSSISNQFKELRKEFDKGQFINLKTL
ncbi:MAG: ATP synthase F1 subunit delta [Tenacibaculum sp.]|nr:ATP synthase F1 subunit delta [Tenacibaculum sp.]